MTKKEIVERLHEKTGFTQKDCAEYFESVMTIVKDTLIGGEYVKLSGFGCFEVRSKSKRRGRNPQNGEAITISARKILSFRPSAQLKHAINSQDGKKA